MKNIITLLMIISAMTLSSCGESEVSDKAKVQEQIIALEKTGWEAWKKNDPEWFKTNTAKEFLSVNSESVSNRDEVIRSVSADCNVNSYSLENFKFAMPDENTAVLIYTAYQDGICSGNKITPKIRVAVTYVKKDGKWLEALYMETPSGTEK